MKSLVFNRKDDSNDELERTQGLEADIPMGWFNKHYAPAVDKF